jgi:phosphatidylglycerophosphate synthase
MSSALPFVALGRNDTRLFGLSAEERLRRFATKAGLTPLPDIPPEGAAILADLAFAWDPAWLRYLAEEPGLAVTLGGRPVLVHCRDEGAAGRVSQAMLRGQALPDGASSRSIRVEDGQALYNHALRKREQLYVSPLAPETARAVEKASYDAAYKGVTDLLTLYLWRGAAFHLTRWAAMAGLSPNMVTTIGAAFCIATFFFFVHGYLWTGLGTALAFMVLDTVDGKLARCTGTSSKWGNLFDHGIDQVHPPFWYWAWGQGLDDVGDALSAGVLWETIAVVMGGYVLQRLIEVAFVRSSGGIQIHAWRRTDSRFRLITARRNPNMVILTVSLLLSQPARGLIAVGIWTVASCAFHAVRLSQALSLRSRGTLITSWLA